MSNKEPFNLKYPALLRPEVLADFELSDRDKIIYAVIASLIGGKKGGYCWLTNQEIADTCGKDERSIKRAIKSLTEKEYIFIDTDRARVKKNKPIRHIYVDYKYYCDRNKKIAPIPSKFKNIHHFRNWAKSALFGMSFTHTKPSGSKIKCMIDSNGYIKNVGLNEQLHPIEDKDLVFKIWGNLYKDNETCIKWYKAKHNLNEENKENE